MQTDLSSNPPTHLTALSRWHWLLALLPALMVLTVVTSLVWLPWNAQKRESSERQEQLIADTLWVEQTVRLQLARDEEALRRLATAMLSHGMSASAFRVQASALQASNKKLVRLVWLDMEHNILEATAGPARGTSMLSPLSAEAADGARRTGKARYSAPTLQAGTYSMDYHLPLMEERLYRGSLLATYSTAAILEQIVPWWFAQDNEILLVDLSDNIIERRAVNGPGLGVYTHAHALDLPGANLTLRTNSLKAAPQLLPDLLVAAVVTLTLALLASLVALWRDINRRLVAEKALRQQVSFRTAMENSLVTGLRARDLEGRVTYVNPAFCAMVGTRADELVGRHPPMPYWAPEAMAEYQKRFSQVLAGTITPQGFETIFQRADGERFPVLIFESPLLDDSGKQTGWMGSILDISDRKKVEDLNRQQQAKLESSARLASMGEIASTLAHELNQPLAAISSYTTGALNMLASNAFSGNDANGIREPDTTLDLDGLRFALEKAGTQAQRAGQIIRSVHAFVKQREPAREPVSVQALIDGIVPLVELQTQKFYVVLDIRVVPGLPLVLADRVLIEQVLLNLTRNAIEAMEHVSPQERILQIVASRDDLATNHSAAPVCIAVIDRGKGIAPEVEARLFSPFFSTKAEGMGMGLNICRTAVEFHGGRLLHYVNPKGGTIFTFSLPVIL